MLCSCRAVLRAGVGRVGFGFYLGMLKPRGEGCRSQHVDMPCCTQVTMYWKMLRWQLRASQTHLPQSIQRPRVGGCTLLAEGHQ